MAYETYEVRVHNSGTKSWYQNGKLHREDGPAIEYSTGSRCWLLEGTQYSEKDFLKKISPVKELTVAEIETLLGYPIKVIEG